MYLNFKLQQDHQHIYLHYYPNDIHHLVISDYNCPFLISDIKAYKNYFNIYISMN